MTQLPAGWYADPEDQLLERWWDGARWTLHTRRVAVLSDDSPPLGGEVPPPYGARVNLPPPDAPWMRMPPPASAPQWPPTSAAPAPLKRAEPASRSKLVLVACAVLAMIAFPSIPNTVVSRLGPSPSPSPRHSAPPASSPDSSPETSSAEEPRTPVEPRAVGEEPEWVRSLAENGVRTEAPYAVELRAYVRHLASWWDVIMPTVLEKPFEPLEGGLIAATPRTKFKGCLAGYELVENAFFAACEDLIAYDDVKLFPRLYESYGPVALGVILAHEWGHAVQHRAGVADVMTSHTAEMQADCYAGAWLSAFKLDAGTQALASGSEDFNALAAIVGELSYWDIGVDAGDHEESHGSAFDRVAAFMDGRENGPAKCVLYTENPPTPVMPVWTSYEDYFNDGDLTGAELAEVLTLSTTRYWPALPDGSRLPTPMQVRDADEIGCVKRPGELFFSWCKNVIAQHETTSEYGDFAVGAALGLAWADAYKSVSATPSHRACLVGEWMRKLERGAVADVALSPGDIDEAIVVMLFADSAPDENGRYSLRHLEEFKAGYLRGCAR